jgi:hypothetical protein
MNLTLLQLHNLTGTQYPRAPPLLSFIRFHCHPSFMLPIP